MTKFKTFNFCQQALIDALATSQILVNIVLARAIRLKLDSQMIEMKTRLPSWQMLPATTSKLHTSWQHLPVANIIFVLASQPANHHITDISRGGPLTSQV